MAGTAQSGGAPGADGATTGGHEKRLSHYQKAADLAVTAHPLDGEDLETPYLEDAQMWLSVYTELLQFKETLLRDTARALETMSPQGYEEVSKTDAVLLDAEAQRFRQRLGMWKQRCAELSTRA